MVVLVVLVVLVYNDHSNVATLEHAPSRRSELIFLTTDHAASSYGIPVLLVYGKAYGPNDNLDSVLKDKDRSIFDFLADKIPAADWVYDNLVIRRTGQHRPTKADQTEIVQAFLGDCEYCQSPGSRWY